MLLEFNWLYILPILTFIFAVLSHVANVISTKVILYILAVIAVAALFSNLILLQIAGISILLFQFLPKEKEDALIIGNHLSSYSFMLFFLISDLYIVKFFSLFAILINTVFLRQVQSSRPKQIHLNLFSIFLISCLVFYYLLSTYGSDLLSSNLALRALPASLLCLVLLAYYMLSLFVVESKTLSGLRNGLYITLLFSFMSLDVVTTFDLFSARQFEAPYLARFLQWFVFIALVLLPLLRFIKGCANTKNLALLHAILFLPLMYFAVNPNLELEVLSHYIISVLAVIGLSYIMLSKQKGLAENLGFLILVFLCLSPLNHALQKIIVSVFNTSNFWAFSQEILYFPFILVPLSMAASLFCALCLCNDSFRSMDLPVKLKSAKFNLYGLVSITVFVLGIYPLPLYIYMQIILEK